MTKDLKAEIRGLELRCLRLEEENERLRTVIDGITDRQRKILSLLPPTVYASLTASYSMIVATLLSMGTVVSKERLHAMTNTRAEETTDTKVVDVHVCKIRKILKRDFDIEDGGILTIWGVGYEASPALRRVVREHMEKHIADQRAFEEVLRNATREGRPVA